MTPGDELLFLALGGSGEIGMNANLYGCRGKWVMVDLGVTFADQQYPGIELVLPDLSFIEERREDLLGIVLTHGHEDHIGAVPYLAADLGVPLYATPFTAGLVAGKLEEEGLLGDVELNVVENGGTVELGDFSFRYVPLAHSIAEGNGLLIETPFGRVFHTGDWKLDSDPLIGQPASPETLRKIGDDGVLALVCDSTNVFNPRQSGSEAEVRDGLMQVVSAASGRVVVTTFASNVARLQTLGQVAKASGRQLCLAGRSLDRIVAVAKANGYLHDLPPLIDWDRAMELPGREVMILATGGQGEARAALARMAESSHPIKLREDDLVIFSSKEIPGNEIAIGRVQNAFAARNIRMVTEKQAHIHVSGHPGRPELLAMYEWLRPRVLVPVHGEVRHMVEQARLGRAHGIEQAVVQKNGDMVRLAPGPAQVIGFEHVGRLVLDGEVILPADGASVNERRRLAFNGHVSVAVSRDKTGRLAGSPQIRLQGVPLEEDREAFLAEAREEAAKAVTAAGGMDEEALRERVRLVVRRAATRWTGKKPIVDVLIIDI
ncbi:MAG TPA: ribonuclease J [Sphingobium sp.]|nr:ribonuclease J [Sphingobium sp.]